MDHNKVCLINKKCTPCQGGVPPLTEEKATALLKELSQGWRINKIGHLYKEYKFDNFMDPLEFTNKIAVIAETEGHHPDITISWGVCKVEIWTHKINGLTESDFILAAKIESLLV